MEGAQGRQGRKRKRNESRGDGGSDSPSDKDGPQTRKQPKIRTTTSSTSSFTATAQRAEHSQEEHRAECVEETHGEECREEERREEESTEERREESTEEHREKETAEEEHREETDTPEDWVIVDNPPTLKGKLHVGPRASKRKKRKKLTDITYYPGMGANSYYFVRDKYPMEVRVTPKVNVSIKSQLTRDTSIEWPVFMPFCLEMHQKGKQTWQDTSEGSCSGPGEQCCSFEIPSNTVDGYLDKDGTLKLYLYDSP